MVKRMESTWQDDILRYFFICFLNTLIYAAIYILYRAKNPGKIKPFYVGYVLNLFLLGCFIYTHIINITLLSDDFMYVLYTVGAWFALTIFLAIYAFIKTDIFKVKENNSGPGLY